MLLSLLRGAAFALFLAASAAFAQGQIIIVNANAPGVGFNDPTPAAPVGGNPGTTLGQQRLNVFEFAAGIWEATLHPTTDIFVIAQFVPLGPNVLGSASATFVFADFPGAELPGTWYASALADKLAGFDLNPGFADIAANFSTNFVFYLGFDNNEGALVDLLPVVLHEIGHGLGFANFVNEAAGTLLQGTPDVYSEYTLDVTTNKNWNEMTVAERQASAINVRKVSWSGINVHKDVPQVLQPGEPALTITSPAGLGPFMVGAASFGPQLTAAGTSGEIVQGTPADGCTPLTNASAVAGKIALLDRGTCTFVVKVKTAQDAGAIAVIIADNVAGSPPPGLGGADPTITIPSVRITLADGNTLKAAAPPVVGSLGLDLSNPRRNGPSPRPGDGRCVRPGRPRFVDIALGRGGLPQSVDGTRDQQRPDQRGHAAPGSDHLALHRHRLVLGRRRSPGRARRLHRISPQPHRRDPGLRLHRPEHGLRERLPSGGPGQRLRDAGEEPRELHLLHRAPRAFAAVGRGPDQGPGQEPGSLRQAVEHRRALRP